MPIDTSQFRALIDTKAVKSVEVLGTPEGFKIVINGNVELYTQRGQLKTFANANSVIRYLKTAGITRFVFDLKGI